MFKKLFGTKSSSPTTSTPALSSGTSRTILESLGLRSLPVMPSAAQQSFQLATNPKADALDFIEVIEADEGLSARVLKIANSVFYDRGGGSKTISDAVQVIGTSELRGLLNASALTDLFPSKHKLRQYFWSHDIATALTAKVLARRLLPSQVDQALLAGLMHDIGKLLMLQKHPAAYELVARKAIAHGVNTIEAEAEEYPFDHTEVGQLIAEKWLFSPDLIGAIRLHHQPWENLPRLSLASITKAGNVISHSLGLGEGSDTGGNKRLYETQLDQTWQALGISKGDQKGIIDDARRTFNTEYEIYASWSGS